MKPHATRDSAALAYLASRNALHKLAVPVSCLLTGDQRHGEALRRRAKHEATTRLRSRRFTSWGLPVLFLPTIH